MTASQRARITEGWTAVQDTTPGRVEARTAFEAFYESERSRAIALAAALCGNRWAAEELAHDAFVSAWQQWDRVGAYDAPSLWLRRAIIHRVISRARRTASEARALGRLATGRAARVPELAAEHEAFWREVRALPPRQAQAVTLFYLEDRSVEQIAIVLEVSPGAVRNALHSGRQRLRARLDQSGDPMGGTTSAASTAATAVHPERAGTTDRPAPDDRLAPDDRPAPDLRSEPHTPEVSP